MSIKTDIIEKYALLKSEKEIRAFLNELVTALHDINEDVLCSLVNNGYINEEQKEAKDEQVKTLLRQIFDSICKNVKLDDLNKKAKAYDALKASNEELQAKIELAQQQIDEAKNKIEIAKKQTHNELKKKLQIGRDKVVAIANTSTELSGYIENAEAMDVLNNIRDNVSVLTNEMISLGLWDDGDEKPEVQPIVLKAVEKVEAVAEEVVSEETPKKKRATKTTKKTETSTTASQSEESLDDFDTLDDEPKVIAEDRKQNIEEPQISLLETDEEKKTD